MKTWPNKIATNSIGTVGQSLISMLAASVGATPNQSGNDEMGWDVLLQFDVAGEEAGPLDRAVPQRTCWLQVKTTTGRKRSWPIKLTNWRRMVTDPSPWFIAIVQLDSTRSPESVHVVHVDEAWSTFGLRELRLASRPGSKPANKLRPAVRWDESNLLPQISGAALLAAVNGAIGTDYERYVREKSERNRVLGYDGPAHSMSLSVRDADLNELADLAIGLRQVVPGDWCAKTHDLRFGIPHEIAAFDRSSGDMELHAGPQGDLKLSVSSGGAWPSVELDCEVFRARNVFPFLPSEFDKVRIVSKHVSLLVQFGADSAPRQATVTASLSVEEALTLLDVERAARTVLHLSEPGGATLTLSCEGRASSLRPQVNLSGVEQLATFRLFEAVAWVCRAFGLEDDASIHLGMASSHRDHFDFITSLLRGPLDRPLAVVGSRRVEPGKRLGAIGVVSAPVGDSVLLAVYGIHGEVSSCEQQGEKWRVSASDLIALCDQHVVPVSAYENFELHSKVTAMRSRMGKLGLEHIFGDPSLAAETRPLAKKSGRTRARRRPPGPGQAPP